MRSSNSIKTRKGVFIGSILSCILLATIIGFLLYICSSKELSSSIEGEIVQVEAGNSRSYVITDDGTLWTWGGFEPSFGIVHPIHSRPVAIMEDVVVSAGYAHTMIINSDDTLWGWGWSHRGQLGDGEMGNRAYPMVVMENVQLASASGGHSIALDNEGVLWAWGSNSTRQLGDGTRAQYRAYPVKVR